MPKDSENTHSETTPHRDGQREQIINDDSGKQIGVTDGREKPIELVADEKMREFKRNMEK
ncbi:hypothetical protein [Halobacillus amylolyticus]|uniref:YpzI family protein n=1 Tax=Halobacillus amylolyticus TaxID=2932259 RepID=A0ABY4HAA5_9BACI|nr:hypothetical protein [Halobacillus amylolyticus]UOR11368.1 hypothetical protein MUO15_17490 [Halobacillus amylolyticus]